MYQNSVTKKIFILLLICIFGIFMGACSPEETTDEGAKDNNTPKTANQVDAVSRVTEQWEKSAHAKAIDEDNPEEAPGMNEGGKCFFCHNGYAFERKAEKLEGIGILKGTSCDTCHIGYAKTLMKDGSIELPIGNIKGGTGTLCIACHMGRGKEPNQESAPHHSVQTDMMFGKSGAQVKGFDYGKSPHANVENSCLSCHMTEDKDGVSDHLFKMNEENAGKSCGKCHGFSNFNPDAKADYDGDGNKEGIQDEVQGLLDLLEKEIKGKLNGGSFESGHGQIIFKDEAGTELDAPPSPELYNAVWNLFFVQYDGSKGIHNPVYSIQLLQQSYKELTGNDVPKAEIR